MRAAFLAVVERGRESSGRFGSPEGADYGRFRLMCPTSRTWLCVLVSAGDAELNVHWEHVSVSTRGRCPTWEEMHWVKTLFWGDEEPVMQLHPPASQYVNQHPYCLHLWRPAKWSAEAIPLPPTIAVGDKNGPRLTPLDPAVTP